MCIFVIHTHFLNMKYSSKFYLEKRSGVEKNFPINLNVTFNGKRMDYFTGLKCNLDQWDGHKVKLTKLSPTLPNELSHHDFNAQLSRLNLAVNEIFQLYDKKNRFPTVLELRNELKIRFGKSVSVKNSYSIFDRYKQYMSETKKSDWTNKSDKSYCKKLKTYKPDLNYDTLDVQFLTDYKKYLIKTAHLSENSAATILGRLRTFVKYSIRHGWAYNNPFADFPIGQKVYGDPVYLTLEERDKLFYAEIEDEILASTRDTFVLQCFLGCRIGDLLAMTKSNIIGNNIEYIAAKTKDENPRLAVVPLTKKALQIIEKYDLPDERLVPPVLVYYLNKRLKRVVEMVGITRKVIIPDKKTRKSKQVRICDIVSTHMARRVFIGGLFKKGVKDSVISSMSGHIIGSKAFTRYFHVDNDDQKEAIRLIE